VSVKDVSECLILCLLGCLKVSMSFADFFYGVPRCPEKSVS
jgi:hypothetical protein